MDFTSKSAQMTMKVIADRFWNFKIERTTIVSINASVGYGEELSAVRKLGSVMTIIC